MIWLIITISFLFIGIGLIALGNLSEYPPHGANGFIRWCWRHDDTLNIFGWTLAICNGITVVCLLCTFATLPDYTREKLYEYENTKALVESYDGYDFGKAFNLTDKIVEINDVIAQNKAYSVSKWRGLYYSKEIGNLEPILFNPKGDDVTGDN